MRDGPPSAVSLPCALSSRRTVQAAVKSRFSVDMPLRTVTEYLHCWGFTSQRPADVQRWLDEECPAIEWRAKADRSEIHWGGAAVRQDTAWVRSFAPAGRTSDSVTEQQWAMRQERRTPRYATRWEEKPIGWA